MSALTSSQLAGLLAVSLPRVDHRGEMIDEIGADFVRMRLPVRAEFLSVPPGAREAILSGPITMGFADTALYACVHAFYGANVLAVIVTFNVAFLRVASGSDLTAVARLLRRGRSLAFVEAHLFSGHSGDPCAHVTATYSVRAVEHSARGGVGA